jgi:hypothetical protein
MTSLPKLTLNSLLNFIFENEEEREAFNKCSKVLSECLAETKEKYYSGYYYLGGQIKMHPDDELSLKKIEKARDITKQKLNDYGGPCNSWEAASVWNSERRLNEMENLIKNVLNIFTSREAKKILDKTNLNSDVNSNIVSYLL